MNQNERRDMFAAAALQGVIVAAGKDPWSPEYAAKLAAEHADALIAVLRDGAVDYTPPEQPVAAHVIASIESVDVLGMCEQLFADIEAELPPHQAFSVDVVTFRHSAGLGLDRRWSIYDGAVRKIHNGATPQEALAALKASRAADVAIADELVGAAEPVPLEPAPELPPVQPAPIDPDEIPF